MYNERHYGHARLEAMLDAHGSGVSDPTLLIKIANKAEGLANNRSGLRYLRKFDKYTKNTPEVAKVIKSPHLGKVDGIYRWIEPDESLKMPILPVKIKRTSRAVEEFKKSKSFNEREGQMLVLNLGIGVSEKKFKKALRSELRRVAGILDIKPHEFDTRIHSLLS